MSPTGGGARSLIAPGLASLVALAILVSLGLWQLKRLAWKEALIATIEARAHSAPVAAPAEAEWPGLKPDDYDYRHVRLAGVYDVSRQALVFRALGSPRGRWGGPGYLVMTPLKLASGAEVLVNRGFVPEGRKDAASEGGGPAEVVGLMRPSEGRTLFTPADDPAHGVWFTRDVAEIAAALQMERPAPFSIDADAGPDPAALPEGGETIVSFPNNHLNYAITWFGLALALAGVFTAYAATRLRGGRGGARGAIRASPRAAGRTRKPWIS